MDKEKNKEIIDKLKKIQVMLVALENGNISEWSLTQRDRDLAEFCLLCGISRLGEELQNAKK